MMASIGSFPFLVETNAESTVFLLHTRNLKFPQKFGTWNSSSIEHSGARGLGRGRLNYRCSRGLFCLFGNSRIRAVGKNFGTNEDRDESEEVLHATIEKSKKVLALQKELLQQIADRKKMVSSIKSESIPESEGDGISYQNESLSSDSNPEKVSASRGSKSEGESISYQNSDKSLSSDKSQSRGSAVENQNDRIVLGNYVLSRQKENLDGSSVGSDRSFDKDEEEHDEFSPVEMVSSKLDEQLKNKRYDTVRRETLPNEIANGFQVPELNVENREGVTESSPKEVANKADDVESEVEKPPPLAGANAMNVILVAAECAPWAKTGGLGDVAGSLPKALARRGHRVMVVVPRYGDYREAQETGVRKRYKVDGQDMEVTYLHAYIDGVDFVFIDSPVFRHLGNNIYDGKRVDILKRMVLFCKAAVEVPWHVPCGGICYGDGNLAFIANDWHTALLPVYLKAYYRDHGLMKYTRSVLVIHNIAHQGRGPLDEYNIMDLPEQYKDLFRLYDPVGGEHLNIFAAGLKMADRIVTVSHGYAWELKTLEGGWGLHGIINENDWKFRGIVNGIDNKDWNPQFDVHLKSDGYINYTLETLHTGKPQCKAALQKELGLPVREDVPLIGFIGRLDGQKGVDLIAEAIPWMMGQDVQLVMLGTGRPDLEQMLREVESQHRDKVRGWVGFSVKTAHRITAGSDILLMPSRFEPCGLNQLYAMNYGTVPVVHAVGGLRDTVTPFNPFEESGLGWTFDSAEANKLIHALGNCLLTYRQYKKSWEGLQQRGMTQDLSWDNAAQHYEEVLVAAKYQW